MEAQKQKPPDACAFRGFGLNLEEVGLSLAVPSFGMRVSVIELGLIAKLELRRAKTNLDTRHRGPADARSITPRLMRGAMLVGGQAVRHDGLEK